MLKMSEFSDSTLDESVSYPLYSRLDSASSPLLSRIEFLYNKKEENKKKMQLVRKLQSPNCSGDLNHIVASEREEGEKEIVPQVFKNNSNKLEIEIEKMRFQEDANAYSGNKLFYPLNNDVGEIKNGKKFSYLKKGHGLQRYGNKSLKGFKKKSQLQNFEPQKELKLTNVLLPNSKYIPLKENKPMMAIEKPQGLTVFETLEELVEHESFVSTSSGVQQLLQNDSSLASTPVVLGRCLPNERNEPTFDFKDNLPKPIELCNKAYLQRSPVRSLVFGQDLSPIVKEQIGTFKNNYKSDTCKTGILKSNFDHVLEDKSSPRVQFLNCGVKVIEYNDDNESSNDNHSHTTVGLEDSDLINISDLENLKLLNYNVQVLHEVSSSGDQMSRTCMNLQKSDFNLSGSPKLLKNIMDNMLPNSKSLDNSDAKKIPAPCKNKFQNEKDDYTEAHKMLLLAKVDELNKEINNFKQKNNKVDNLIAELKEEKSKLSQYMTQEKPDKNSQVSKVAQKRINVKKNATNDTVVSKKLQQLSEKICNLETENNLLKRKVNLLEKKEKELKKTHSQLQRYHEDESSKVKNTSSLNTQKSSMKKYKPLSTSTNIKPKVHFKEHDLNENTQNKMIDSQELLLKENENISNEDKHEVYPKNDNLLTGYTNVTDDQNSCSDNKEFDHNSKENMNYYGNNQKNYVEKNHLFLNLAYSLKGTQSEQINFENGEVITYHSNGDIETKYSDRIVYIYSKDKITRNIYHEGKEVIEFPNGQTEVYFSDGSQQILFPDGSCTTWFKDGMQKTVASDGTTTLVNQGGSKVVEFPNGQKEVHLQNEVQRIYPDGTVKILHQDGTQETRYTNGRIRIKDREGNVTMK